MSLAHELSRLPEGGLGKAQSLPPLLAADEPPTPEGWSRARARLRQAFEQLLGQPAFDPGSYPRGSVVMDVFEEDPDFTAVLFRQPTGPGHAQRVLVLRPRRPMASPCPGVVVPFYHPDHSSGLDLGTRLRRDGEPLICFGRHLAHQGYFVACSEAFPFNTIPGPVVEGPGFAAWHAGAARLRERHPQWTGMGKLTHDTRRAIDLLLEQPGVDASRIALMGHSLGGKMSFYAGCLDERVRATVANDFGIGWDFTNWDQPWYLGERVAMVRDRLAHHQLLALHAPRPLLLIAGEADRLESWQYLQAASQAYAIAGRSEGLGCIAHHSGHEPTPRSLSLAYQWLAEQLDVRPRAWTPPG